MKMEVILPLMATQVAAVRIAQLEAEKTKLLDRMDENIEETLKDRLASINKDLATVKAGELFG